MRWASWEFSVVLIGLIGVACGHEGWPATRLRAAQYQIRTTLKNATFPSDVTGMPHHHLSVAKKLGEDGVRENIDTPVAYKHGEGWGVIGPIADRLRCAGGTDCFVTAIHDRDRDKAGLAGGTIIEEKMRVVEHLPAEEEINTLSNPTQMPPELQSERLHLRQASAGQWTLSISFEFVQQNRQGFDQAFRADIAENLPGLEKSAVVITRISRGSTVVEFVVVDYQNAMAQLFDTIVNGTLTLNRLRYFNSAKPVHVSNIKFDGMSPETISRDLGMDPARLEMIRNEDGTEIFGMSGEAPRLAGIATNTDSTFDPRTHDSETIARTAKIEEKVDNDVTATPRMHDTNSSTQSTKPEPLVDDPSQVKYHGANSSTAKISESMDHRQNRTSDDTRLESSMLTQGPEVSKKVDVGQATLASSVESETD